MQNQSSYAYTNRNSTNGGHNNLEYVNGGVF